VTVLISRDALQTRFPHKITTKEGAVSKELVSYELSGRVATIAMDDGKANVLSLQMLAAINEALDQASFDDAVVLLTGREGIFSGGFDLNVLRDGGPDSALMLEQGFVLALRLLLHPEPVVIACNGHAVAMGSFLLLSGDYRVGASGSFRLVANEVAIGLTMPWSAIEICRQRLAPAHFNRAVILAESFTPPEAVPAGFLDRVVEVPDLRETAVTVAKNLAVLDRPAHAATKVRARESAVVAIRKALEIDRETFRTLTAEQTSR
jgi:enoyl-CoA hydratase